MAEDRVWREGDRIRLWDDLRFERGQLIGAATGVVRDIRGVPMNVNAGARIVDTGQGRVVVDPIFGPRPVGK